MHKNKWPEKKADGMAGVKAFPDLKQQDGNSI